MSRTVGRRFFCVAAVEMAGLDLIGRRQNIPVGRLFGKPRRNEVPVYTSRFPRDNSAQEEAESVGRVLDRTGASACKRKVGRRMKNHTAQSRRDFAMVALARETFGDEVAIYLDANGSYQTAEEGLCHARKFERRGASFLEEPCPRRFSSAVAR